MKLKDVISAIRFNTSTTDDLSGKAAQSLFTNKTIIQQLGYALDAYASFTKGIEGIYSTQVINTQSSVTPPSDILNSQGLRFIFIYTNGLRYPIIEQDPNNIYANFYTQNIKGIPGWFLYWGNKIDLFPMNSSNPLTSTLTESISESDTTIVLNDVISLATQNGRITIGSEKIEYKNREGTILTGCIRGVEDTIPASHLINSTVTENNCHMLYYKLHWKATVYSDDKVDDIYALRDMEVPDEHLDTIITYTSYKLLMKIPSQRELASAYRVDFEAWLRSAKHDVQKGRTCIVNAGDVRDPFWFENNQSPYNYF